MRKFVPILISGGLLASLLLAGCSANSEAEGTAAANNQADRGSAAKQPQANGNQQNGRPNMSMNFGKIKSVSDTTLTLYKSDMSMPRQGAGEGDGQNSQGGTPPEKPDGDQNTGNGAAPEGGKPQGEMPEGGGQGGGPQGGRMQQSFSDETTDITIDADTKIVAVTFDNGTRQENAITLAELKADDIIQYTFKSDSTVAESITLSNGNPGGATPDDSTSSSS
ncbi:hypothetical protein MHB77_24875 [Paenibacillus sp. FSL K6-3166]|uniref:hypothetical protein n=1 Tax=unclassified Paenibacillus TaxID=185978 RepID=UPI000BA147D7|nr:hypothetical protein [Paenibacillus sp. VTT E-133291]OZQ97865.1 hypothetical protein CA598_03870 [Paenibacillus sp. VTT E-133291]